MAFNRSIELGIGTDGTGLLISDLDVGFLIERSNTISENTAEFTIYNAKESTRKEISREGNNIIFKYGYEDENKLDKKGERKLSTIFMGNVSAAKSVQLGPDWATTIIGAMIGSKDVPISNVDIIFSYTPGTLLSQPLNDIRAAMGLAIYGLDNANISLENGFTFTGSARAALKECKDRLKAHDVALYIDNNTIVIYNIGSRVSRFSPVFLDYNSGLLRVDDITEYNNQSKETPKRIEFESIIIPKLNPNGLITIKNTGKLEGTYLIEKLALEGDNFGGENRCSGEAIE